MENFIYIITGVVAIAVFLYYSIKPANSGTTFHYPQEHLQEIKHKIAFYPINEQVQYAGAQIKSRVNDPDYVRAFLDGAEFDVMGDFDTTTVGNLAYIALYSHIGDARERASAYIRAYARWVKDHGFVSDQDVYEISNKVFVVKRYYTKDFGQICDKTLYFYSANAFGSKIYGPEIENSFKFSNKDIVLQYFPEGEGSFIGNDKSGDYAYLQEFVLI